MWNGKVTAQLVNFSKSEYEEDIVVKNYVELSKRGLYSEEEEAVVSFLKQPSKILILGCGTGRECFALAQMGHQVVGIDFSKGMIQQARELALEKKVAVRFIESDFCQEIPLKESFDVIIFSMNVYCLIPSKAFRAKILQKMTRYLTSEGFLLLFIEWAAKKKNIFYHNPVVAMLRLWKRKLFDYPLQEVGDTLYSDPNGKEQRYFYYFQRSEEIASEFISAGFSILHHGRMTWVLQPLLRSTSCTLK